MRQPPGPFGFTTFVLGAAALVWLLVGIQVVAGTDVEPRVLVATGAFAVTGWTLGAILFSTPRAVRVRAERGPREHEAGFFGCVGLMLLGLGLSGALGQDPNTWEWTFLVALSLLAGMQLALASAIRNPGRINV